MYINVANPCSSLESLLNYLSFELWNIQIDRLVPIVSPPVRLLLTYRLGTPVTDVRCKPANLYTGYVDLFGDLAKLISSAVFVCAHKNTNKLENQNMRITGCCSLIRSQSHKRQKHWSKIWPKCSCSHNARKESHQDEESCTETEINTRERKVSLLSLGGDVFFAGLFTRNVPFQRGGPLPPLPTRSFALPVSLYPWYNLSTTACIRWKKFSVVFVVFCHFPAQRGLRSHENNDFEKYSDRYGVPLSVLPRSTVTSKDDHTHSTKSRSTTVLPCATLIHCLISPIPDLVPLPLYF